MNRKIINFIMEILVLIVVFIMPTIFDRRLGIVFSGTKTTWMRVLGIVIIALWAIKLIVTKKHRFVRTPLDWPVVSFLLCTTIATITSVHVYTSFVGFYGRYEGLTSWFLFGIFFFVVTNYIKSFDQLKRIVVTVLSAATLMGIYSMLQRHSLDPYMWGGVVTWQRVIGMIGQPNFLAAYMLLAFFLVLSLFLMKKEIPAKFDWQEQLIPLGYFFATQIIFVIMIYSLEASHVMAWYFGFIMVTASALLFSYSYQKLHPWILNTLIGASLLIIYICILYTQSRGGYMGFFTGAVLFALVAGRKWLFGNWKKIAVLGGLILLISGVTMLRPEYSPFERFATEVTTTEIEIEGEETSAELELKGAAGSRGETWKSAFQVVADYPFFGIGPEVLKMVFPRYETDLFRFKEAFHVKQDRCHNETFDIPVTKGLIAFGIYLWLLFTVFKTGWIKSKKLQGPEHLLLAGMLAAMLAFIIQNQFSFGVVAITSLFWIIWAMVMIVGENQEEEAEGKTINWQELPWLPIAVVILVSLFLIYVSFFSFRADIDFKLGKSRLQFQQFPQAVAALEESLQVYPFEGGTISHLGIAYLNLSRFGKQKAQALDKAVQILTYGTKVDPYNADNFFMLAKIHFVLYNNAGNQQFLNQAKENAEIAIKIDPYYAEVYDLLGTMYQQQGDIKKAADLYEKAFSLNPNLVEPLQKLSLINPAESLRVLEKVYKKYGNNPLVLERLGQIYLASGHFKKAKKVIMKLRVYYPDNIIGETLLGQYYLRTNDIEKAFNLFQEVILKDPKNVLAHVGLAQTYLKKGDKVRAKNELEQVLMLDPNNQWANLMQGRL